MMPFFVEESLTASANLAGSCVDNANDCRTLFSGGLKRSSQRYANEGMWCPFFWWTDPVWLSNPVQPD